MTAAPTTTERTVTSEVMSRYVRFIQDVSVATLPAEVVAEAKLRVLDALGCAIVGSALPHSIRISDVYADVAGDRPATAIGRPAPVSAPAAALINGALVCSFELDDAGSYVHPGAAVVAASLAAAEYAGASGARLVEAVVAGYEVTVRISEGAGFAAEGVVGWHTPAFHGAIGAAAAAAKLLDLGPQETVHALAMATDLAGGGLIHARFGSDVKRLHTGRAAQTGLHAALMARAGLTGIPDVLEHPRWGYLRAISYTGEDSVISQADALATTDRLGTDFGTFDRIGYKYYPVTAKGQGIVENIRTIRREHGIDPADIEKITIYLARFGAGQGPTATPAGALRDVNFSYPYAAAIAATSDAAPVYESQDVVLRWLDGLADERVARVQRLVEVAVSEEIDARNPYSMDSIVRVDTAHGSYTNEVRLGDDAVNPHAVYFRPMSPDQLRQKFRNLAGIVLPAEAVAALEERILALESLDGVGALTEPLRRETTPLGT